MMSACLYCLSSMQFERALLHPSSYFLVWGGSAQKPIRSGLLCFFLKPLTNTISKKSSLNVITELQRHWLHLRQHFTIRPCNWRTPQEAAMLASCLQQVHVMLWSRRSTCSLLAADGKEIEALNPACE